MLREGFALREFAEEDNYLKFVPEYLWVSGRARSSRAYFKMPRNSSAPIRTYRILFRFQV